MWDNHSTNIKSPEKIYHEEKRAPTDQSIQLAKEYEEKILRSILEKVLVHDNLFEYTVVITDNIMNRILNIKIKINDNEFTNNFNIGIDVDKTLDKVISWFSGLFLRDVLSDICIGHMQGQQNYKHFYSTNKKGGATCG